LAIANVANFALKVLLAPRTIFLFVLHVVVIAFE